MKSKKKCVIYPHYGSHLIDKSIYKLLFERKKGINQKLKSVFIFHFHAVKVMRKINSLSLIGNRPTWIAFFLELFMNRKVFIERALMVLYNIFSTSCRVMSFHCFDLTSIKVIAADESSRNVIIIENSLPPTEVNQRKLLLQYSIT